MLLRVMSVRYRNVRSRAIPVFFGLDPFRPSFRYARRPIVLGVLQARFQLHRGRCPGPLHLACFFTGCCGNERAADYDGLVGKGNIFELFNCGC